MVAHRIQLLKNVIDRARVAAFQIIRTYPQDLKNSEYMYACFVLGKAKCLPGCILSHIFEFVLMMPEQAMREREVVVDALRQICEPYESRPFDVVRMSINNCISLKEAEGVPTWDLFCVKELRSDGSIEKFKLCYLYQGKVVPLDSRPLITFHSPPPPRMLGLESSHMSLCLCLCIDQ